MENLYEFAPTLLDASTRFVGNFYKDGLDIESSEEYIYFGVTVFFQKYVTIWE
jgi:hypothetical protein